MSAVIELPEDVAVEIAGVLPSARARFGVDELTDPKTVLEKVETQLRKHREGKQLLDQDAVIELGVLVGEQYRRQFGWSWAQVYYESDTTPIYGVLNADQSVVIHALHWINNIILDSSQEIAVVLNFNMVEAGKIPTGTPGSPISFH